MEKTKRTWNDYEWPDWVPEEVRLEVEDFWGVAQGRSPDEWEENAKLHRVELGKTVILPLLSSRGDEFAQGRVVHAWNNIGRLVLESGEFRYVYYPMGICGDGKVFK
jgi:hypothetical protein